MTPSVRFILAGILLALVGTECACLAAFHFDMDLTAVLKVLAVAVPPLAAGLYYLFVRSDARVSAMLFGLAFLLVFGPLCTILNYFAVSVAGHLP